MLAGLLLPAVILVGCGGSGSTGSTAASSSERAIESSEAREPALGLTEDNADLLWNPSSPSRAGGALFQFAREQLTALHPRYIRLLVDWAVLQPQRERPANLEGPIDGCARTVGPCAPFAGIRAELAAIATQQRAARAEGHAGFEVVLDVFGVPSWAAVAARGCETASSQPFSRPINEAGIAGYRSLIRTLLALGREQGVALSWWSPWNEPNNPVFLSPQRSACSIAAPAAAPAVYAQLAEAMDAELASDDAADHLLLGELAAYPADSLHRTSVASFVAALPARVLCLGSVWAIHAYAAWGRAAPESDPVGGLGRALDARGSCAAEAKIWVTETGAGAPHPGRQRPAGEAEQKGGMRRSRRAASTLVAEPAHWRGLPIQLP